VLEPEGEAVRQFLVEILARIPGPNACAALARRAVFDLSAKVRAQAIQELARRPRLEYCAFLLDGLRYPWQPAADHAAEALVALQDREVVPQLVGLWRDPNPTVVVGVGTGTGAAARELVRVNHARNCLLCHTASREEEDPARGSIPDPGRSLTSGRSDESFVRADVTYLRQDFSVPQPIDPRRSRTSTCYGGPQIERYDYLVRTRQAFLDDFSREAIAKHREAIRFALDRLDADWRRLLPPSARSKG
jgi:hypothetical protein